METTQSSGVYEFRNIWIGKTIKLEGMCDVSKDYNNNKMIYGVIRNGPGCCGNDGQAGFQFTYKGKYPKANDWIQVIGKLEIMEDGRNPFVLRASQVTVMETRGLEKVPN